MNRFVDKAVCEKAAHRGPGRVTQIVTLLFAWLHERSAARSQRLRIVERHALAPGQSLVLVEADGRSLLIASSREASPVFFPLEAAPSSESRESGNEELSRRSSAGSIRLERPMETPVSMRSSRRAL